MRQFLAKLFPLTDKAKGHLLTGSKAYSVVSFADISSYKNPWSIVAELEPIPTDGSFLWGKVYLLVDEAPHELLYLKKKFEFQDGKKPFMWVEILNLDRAELLAYLEKLREQDAEIVFKTDFQKFFKEYREWRKSGISKIFQMSRIVWELMFVELPRIPSKDKECKSESQSLERA